MTGNASYRLKDTAVLSVCAVEAPVVVTSAEFDARLMRTYERTGMKPGMIEQLAGMTERRWWPEDVTLRRRGRHGGREGAGRGRRRPLPGRAADQHLGLPDRHSSRPTAVGVHDQLGLSTSCLNFDLTNACLGFLNGIQLAGTMIDAGQVDYALLVDGEGMRGLQERHRRAARGRRRHRRGRQAAVRHADARLGRGRHGARPRRASTRRATASPGGVSRAGTEHKDLCIGDLTLMRTDSTGALRRRHRAAGQTWHDALADGCDWAGADWYIAHQISLVHLNALAEALGVDPSTSSR